MLNYISMQNLSYDELLYRQFFYTNAVYKRTPFKVLVYESEKGRAVVIVFSKTQTGGVVTRHLRFSTENASKIAELIRDSFPLVDVQYLDNPPDDEM